MKKFVRQTTIYFSILLFSILVYLLLLEKYLTNLHDKTKLIATKESNTEVLITGTSHTLWAINPKSISYNTSNIAEINKPASIDFKIIYTYFKTFKKLKMVVIPVDYFTLYFDGENENYSKRYYHHWNLNTSFFKFHIFECTFPTPINIIFDKKKKKTFSNYFPHYGNWNNEKNKKTRINERLSAWNKNWINASAKNKIKKEFIHFIKFCNSNKIKVLLVTMPVPIDMRKAYDNHIQYENRSTIQEIITKTNCEYINFNDFKSFENNTLYSDCDHLNINGSILLSRNLNQKIVSILSESN